MGKRDTRKKTGRRQESTRPKDADEKKELSFLLPTDKDPIIRLTISGKTPEKIREFHLKYWSMKEDGTWTHGVEREEPPRVEERLADYITVISLKYKCRDCSRALDVRNRSEFRGLKNPSNQYCPPCGEKKDKRRQRLLSPGLTAEPLPPQHTFLSAAKVASEANGATKTRSSTASHQVAAPPTAVPRASVPPAVSPSRNDEPHPLLPLEVEVLDDAPEDLVEIGHSYWALTGIDARGRALWASHVSSIDARGRGVINVAAAGGVRASAPTGTCPKCGGPQTFTSRYAFQSACEGALPPCADCAPGFRDKVKQALARPPQPPRQLTDLLQPRTPAHHQIPAHGLATSQQPASGGVSSPAFLPADAIPYASVRAEAVALAMLRYAEATTPISPVKLWATPLHPDRDEEESAVRAAEEAGLLRVLEYPPYSGGTVEPAPGASHGYRAREVTHYAPYGTSPASAADLLDAHLEERLNPDTMSLQRHHDLLRLAVELVAGECVRYFAQQLTVRNLPNVPVNHVNRLRQASHRAAADLSLGVMIQLAWRATKNAAAAAQTSPHVHKNQMTAHAVNYFESQVQRALEGPAQDITPFTSLRYELAGLTRIVFYCALNSDPFTLTPAAAEASFSVSSTAETGLREVEPASLLDSVIELGPEQHEENVQWLRENAEQWAIDEFENCLLRGRAARHLSNSSTDDQLLADTANRLMEILKDSRQITECGIKAVVNTCAAAAMLNTVTITRHGMKAFSGAWIVADFVSRLQAVRGLASETDDPSNTGDEQ
ncbi:hypothetical protein ACFWNG_04945 [Streptomyces sp. NPDC058391]|uniref:hypothetical protein n=1 Tax=Streptomyces sp. NPDC058391 TaxID=3346476 RepID=UPI003665D4AF